MVTTQKWLRRKMLNPGRFINFVVRLLSLIVNFLYGNMRSSTFMTAYVTVDSQQSKLCQRGWLKINIMDFIYVFIPSTKRDVNTAGRLNELLMKVICVSTYLVLLEQMYIRSTKGNLCKYIFWNDEKR